MPYHSTPSTPDNEPVSSPAQSPSTPPPAQSPSTPAATTPTYTAREGHTTNKLLDSILANLPTAIPVDAPIGQWHVDWFLWFINTGVPYANQVNEADPLESLDWRRLGFSVYVQNAWDWLVVEFGYQWDINTLNYILENWGDGGYVGDDIPEDSGAFVSDDGQTGNEALGTIISTSNAINMLPTLYGGTSNPTTESTTQPKDRGLYKLFEKGTSNYIVYNEGDTVSYKNATYIATKETKGGNRPDKSSAWQQVSGADIIGIAITADAGLTGTIWTQEGFHYQNITVATGGITTAHIADNAITSSKIADGAILGVDVAVGVTLTNPDITGDAEVFGNVYITGTAAASLNEAQRNNPVLKISGTNRDIAIDCGTGVISAGYPSPVASSFHDFNISNELSLGTSGRGISAGVSLILGYTGEFTDIISVKGLSSQDGLIDGLTGNFNNIVAHGGISATGITLGVLSANFLGLIASATAISAGLIRIDSGQAGAIELDSASGVSAEGNYIRGYTGTFKNVELVQGLSAQDGLIEGYTGEFNQLVANSGITAKGISTDNIDVKSGVSAGGLVKGNTGEFNQVVAISGISCGGNVELNNSGDVALTLNADSDNSGENDNPLIRLSQDGAGVYYDIGIVGNAGQIFTNSISNAFYIKQHAARDIQFANSGTARYTINSDGMNHFHSGISAEGATFGGGVIIHAGLSASGISTDNIHVKSGISAGGIVKGYTGEFVDIISVNGLSAQGGLVDGKTGNFNEVVAVSGISTGGPVRCQDQEVSRPKLKDYGETVNAIGTITGDTTVDIEAGNVQTVTVSSGATEFDFENWSATGIASTLTLIITNGGSQTVTWVSAVKWPGDNAPALTSSGIDIISFMTIDAGTNIYGFVGGINFS